MRHILHKDWYKQQITNRIDIPTERIVSNEAMSPSRHREHVKKSVSVRA